MKKLFFAALLSVLSFDAANAQSQTFVFEGDAVFIEAQGFSSFNNVQDWANRWGVTDPVTSGISDRVIKTRFNGVLSFDTSQSSSNGITKIRSSGGVTTSYEYDHFTLNLGNQTLNFSSANQATSSRRIQILDSKSSLSDSASLRFENDRTFNENGEPNLDDFTLSGVISLGAPNSSNTFVSNTDAINFERFVGTNVEPIISVDIGNTPTFEEFGFLFTDFGSISLTNVRVTSAIPEPSTWLMMIVGFGVSGLALRRRQRGQKITA